MYQICAKGAALGGNLGLWKFKVKRKRKQQCDPASKPTVVQHLRSFDGSIEIVLKIWLRKVKSCERFEAYFPPFFTTLQ